MSDPETVAANAAGNTETATAANDAENEAAFNKGFNRVRGTDEQQPTTTAKADDAANTDAAPNGETTEGESTTTTTDDAAATATAEDDPWKGVPAIVKDRIEQLSSLSALPDRLRKIEGHIGGLKSQLNAASEAAKATANAGAKAPTKQQIDAAAVSSEKWNAIKRDFPDWADAMDERLLALGQTSNVDVEELTRNAVQSATAQVNQLTSAAVDLAEERAFLRLKHPDWKQTAATPDFQAWLGKQPPDFQGLADSNLADDAISVFDKYAEFKKTEQTKQQRMSRAVQPRGSSGGAPVSNVISDEEAFNRGFKRVQGKTLA